MDTAWYQGALNRSLDNCYILDLKLTWFLLSCCKFNAGCARTMLSEKCSQNKKPSDRSRTVGCWLSLVREVPSGPIGCESAKLVGSSKEGISKSVIFALQVTPFAHVWQGWNRNARERESPNVVTGRSLEGKSLSHILSVDGQGTDFSVHTLIFAAVSVN